MKTTVGDLATRLARHAATEPVEIGDEGPVVHGDVVVLDENPAEPCPVCHHTARK